MEEKEEKKFEFVQVLNWTKDEFSEFKKKMKGGSYNYDTQEEEGKNILKIFIYIILFF